VGGDIGVDDRYVLIGNLTIFDRIMKQCSNDEFRILSVRRFRNKCGNFQKMIDVGFFRSALAALLHVPARRRVRCSKNHDPLFGHLPSPLRILSPTRRVWR
jgi:hypothetical protein